MNKYIIFTFLFIASVVGAEVFRVDTEDDIIANDGFVSLREAIALANANGEDDVIVFADGIDEINVNAVLTANDSGTTLRIEGEITLDGQGITQIFEFVDNDLELDSITFENANGGGDGGAISADSDSNALLVTNCKFNNCTTGGNGGGAFFDSAINGRFSSLEFTNCSATGNGGGLFVGDFDDSDQLTFTNCSAGGNGGGVHIDDDGEDFLDCTFTNCSATGDGGGINSENDLDNFINCTFTNCTADGNGGAFHSDDDVDNIMNCTFTNCTAAGDGGAIDVDANFGEMNNTEFENCSADGSGGAISIEEDSEIWTNCTFKNCTAGVNGGAIAAADGVALISNGVFESCEANGDGGAIFIDTVNVDTEISSTTFTSNRAIGSGGSLAVNDATVVLAAVTFTNNSAGEGQQANDNGGAIFADTGSDVSMEECVFIENKTFFNGGAIFTDGTLTVIDSTFNLNKTNDSNGGAVFYSSNSDVVIERSTFKKNSSANHGGATYANDNAISVFTNCTFSENQADDDGGGHFADNPTSDEFIDCTFSNNQAENGGGIYAQDDNGTANIVNLNSTIVGDNTARVAGNDLFDLQANGGAFDDGGFNLIEDGGSQAIFVDGVNSNIIGVDADLDDAISDNQGTVETHATNSGSAAIDTGDDGNGVAEDARQFGLDGSNDIGAFEFDGTPVIVLTAKDTDVSARLARDGVRIKWSGLNNKQISGFNIWRKNRKERRYKKVNTLLIMSTEGINNNQIYTFRDSSIRDNKLHNHYLLECIATNGKKYIARCLTTKNKEKKQDNENNK